MTEFNKTRDMEEYDGTRDMEEVDEKRKVIQEALEVITHLDDGSVRIEHSLNKKENEFVFNRRKYILQSLKKLHIYCSEYEVPNIALLGSGGGERAMVGLLGSLDQFQKTGLLDCVLYLSGVSGSTWCMASLYQEPDWSTKLETLKDKIVQRLSGPGVSWGDAYDKLMKYYEEKDIFSLTDVWAAMFITTYLKENSQLERRRASEPREMTEFNKTRDMEEVDEKRKIIQETRETIRRIDELLSNKDEGQHADYYELRQTALDKMDNLEHGIERTPVLQYNCDLGEMARDLRQIELSDVDPCFYKADEEKQAKCYQIRERVQEVIDKLSRLDYERVPNDADYIELLDAARDLHQSVSEAALKYSDNEDEGQQGMRRGLMELIPVLEPEEKPRDRQWYVVSASGAAPGVSVGHTCVFLPSADGGKGRIVVVGGANPDGSFSDSYVMNLDTHEWEVPEWAGLQARYEHCSFVPEIEPRSVWVFAGAQKSGNRNCVQVLRTSEGLWETVSVKGDPPSVRTYHTNSACVGNRLYVFSGGDAGADAVADTHVHVFDSVTATWTQPESNGTPPTPRHGHAITAVGSDVYIHGGMSGETLHNDMFLLDTETMKWEKVKAKGEIPPGVAAHSSVSFGKNIFIFGGMTSEGATNSMYKFQCDERRWTLLQFEGDLPPGRLDHSMCSVPWRVTTAGRETCDEDEQRLCFIFGGMDTQGVIFNDCLVTLLT